MGLNLDVKVAWTQEWGADNAQTDKEWNDGKE